MVEFRGGIRSPTSFSVERMDQYRVPTEPFGTHFHVVQRAESGFTMTSPRNRLPALDSVWLRIVGLVTIAVFIGLVLSNRD